MTAKQIDEYHPIDGYFNLVTTKDGRLFAKTWTLADARLAATAPELLETCRAALVGFQEFEALFNSGRATIDGRTVKTTANGFEMSRKLKNIIAKAEGRTA